MAKFAIICSTENQINPRDAVVDGSSTYEKMAILLTQSARAAMPDVDIYLGSFTGNKLSELAKGHFARNNINVVEDTVFPQVCVSTPDGRPLSTLHNDYYTHNGFLRSFTKHYFAEKLLSQHDYLVYIDNDALIIKPFEFEFDPTDRIIMYEPVPAWSVALMTQYTIKPLSGNLYLNWIDVINNHNKHIFDIDYYSKEAQYDHAADVTVTNRIDQSDLRMIEQTVGGYHCYKPLTKQHCAYHYDSLGAPGTFYMIEDVYPALYKKCKLMLDVLNVKIENDVDHWERIRDSYQ